MRKIYYVSSSGCHLQGVFRAKKHYTGRCDTVHTLCLYIPSDHKDEDTCFPRILEITLTQFEHNTAIQCSSVLHFNHSYEGDGRSSGTT